MQYNRNTNRFYQELSNSIRILSADAIEKAESGHPGLPLGFADVFTVLCTKFLKYWPQDPRWPTRDRFVLSAGHGSMLLYSFYHLAGFEGYDLEQIKNFRQLGFITHGHPEFDKISPVETTTGPLGQGFANSVGMAIAQKKYAQRLGPIADYKIYCMVGDGCLMEGISLEAASLAGHLQLNNLIVLFDDNRISIDGRTDLTTSDNHIDKFKALGWEALSVDGHNFNSIEQALEAAQQTTKPCFIAFRTTIGFGAGVKEDSEKSHGAPLGIEAINALRQNLNWSFEEPFFIPDTTKAAWQEAACLNQEKYQKWQVEYNNLSQEEKAYLLAPNKELIKEVIAAYNQNILAPEATRVSFGKVLEKILRASDKVVIGSADLSQSNGFYNKYCHPITKDDFSGNFIHYGVRENAMAAIMNGLATQGFLPFGGTFLVFSDYMRPSIRLSAIMQLPCIYVMTHDSIGVGEDGPTHQPVEHLASFRCMPNLRVFRPCDMVEVEACVNIALSNSTIPSLFALTRQKLSQIGFSEMRRQNIAYGAYVISSDNKNIDITIWATGSEVEIALHVKELLNRSGYNVRVVSAPCLELFFEQSPVYQKEIKGNSKLIVAIEAASSFGWARIIGEDGMFFGVENFGHSGKAEEIYDFLGLTAAKIANKIIEGLNGKDSN